MLTVIIKRFSSTIPLTRIDRIFKQSKTLFDNSNALENVMPRKFTSQEQVNSHFGLNSISSLVSDSPLSLETINKSICDPIYDLLERGGKRWRPYLGLLVAKYLGVDITDYNSNRNLYNAVASVEVLHNATLIIDDIIDKSDFRRNKPCTYKIFGDGIAMNSGIGLMYYPFLRSVKELDEKLQAKFLYIYVEEMSMINLGQTMDFYWNHTQRVISQKDYINCVLLKTGVMPRLVVKLIFEICNHNESKENQVILLRIMDLMSIAFQIKDDLLNITENDLSKSKGFLGEDIFEGKITLMVTHAFEVLEDADKLRLKDILFMKTKDPVLIKEAIKLLEKKGSIEFAENFIKKCVDETKELCQELTKRNGNNDLKKEALEDIFELILFFSLRNI